MTVLYSNKTTLSWSRYSNEFWNSVSLNKKVACFAVGKFTAAEVKKKIGVNCSYPQKHYSSEGLLEIAEMAIGAGENVVVMKGSGGRSLIEEKLSKRGSLVDSFDLYKRTKISFSPKEVPLDRNKLNYIVVLSKDSLDAFTDSFDPKITPYRLVFVAPQRILESHSLKKFSPLKTIIINKMDDAGSYFDVIEKYQRLNKST